MMIKDRVILIALIVSIWALIGTIWLKPSDSFAHDDGHDHYGAYADEGHSHDVSDIDGFKRRVKKLIYLYGN